MGEKLFGLCSYQKKMFPRAFRFLPGGDKDKNSWSSPSKKLLVLLSLTPVFLHKCKQQSPSSDLDTVLIMSES